MGMGCSGTLYAFGAYIDTIKELLQLKQSEVEMIGYIGDAGAYITGPLLGLTVDWFGSATMGSVAAILISAGYLFMGMVGISRYESASKYHKLTEAVLGNDYPWFALCIRLFPFTRH